MAKPSNKGPTDNKKEVGRPRLFNTPKELQERIDDYFENCRDGGKPFTIAGLAYWLEMDRKSIYNYEHKDEYFHTIKRARDKILATLEEMIAVDGRAGQIFLAKNYGYTDKTEIESINVNVEMTTTEAEEILKSAGIIV